MEEKQDAQTKERKESNNTNTISQPDSQLKLHQQTQIHRRQTIMHICQGVFILVKGQS